mmetsp:Transcript_34835/g.100122  ORF Transcript_34835/g.100122 Transcript_34835/m.100122 type:complete len:85 (+) Transcript_34835:591-845(+)
MTSSVRYSLFLAWQWELCEADGQHFGSQLEFGESVKNARHAKEWLNIICDCISMSYGSAHGFTCLLSAGVWAKAPTMQGMRRNC